jgi:hypothetical protein
MRVEEASRQAAEEDKRHRNTVVSARFRVKKQREQALEKTVKEAQNKKCKLEARIAQLEMENKWLKSLVTENQDAKIPEDFQQAHQKLHRDGEETDSHVGHKRGVGTKWFSNQVESVISLLLSITIPIYTTRHIFHTEDD